MTIEASSIQEIPNPAGDNSGEPNLYVSDGGQVYLSWIEPGSTMKSSLRYSTFDSGSWSDSRIIAEGDNWFVNWADFPTMVSFSDGQLAAHWLAKSGDGTFAYDVNVALSNDGGVTWSSPLIPHRDGTATEHGFVSMLPWSDDSFFLTWLDGRNFSEDGKEPPTKEMTLRYTLIGKNGELGEEGYFDLRICDCCQTSAVRTTNGAVVVYRDRSEDEIRDISIVRNHKGTWQEPKNLYADNWKIMGCPVNGPSVDASGENVAVAWFTGVGGKGEVKVIFSGDEGDTFGVPVIVDDGRPIGRVGIVMLEDGAAIVSWMENTEDGAEIRIRHVQSNGLKDEAITVAQSKTSRASGFPQIAKSGDQLYFAWTEAGETPVIRTAVAQLKRN